MALVIVKAKKGEQGAIRINASSKGVKVATVQVLAK